MAKEKYAGQDKWIKERLVRLEQEAGDAVLYDIDVISLVVGTYGTENAIYKAMVKGKPISDMVKKTMKEDDESFTEVLKVRLYTLCVERENMLDNEM